MAVRLLSLCMLRGVAGEDFSLSQDLDLEQELDLEQDLLLSHDLSLSHGTGDDVCELPFDRCWDGSMWKATASCSGVPGTWEALLFADDMEAICDPASLAQLGGGSCSKVSSMCDARKALKHRGCQMSTELKELRSGDTVYLRGYTGMLFDMSNGDVQARWKDHGLWETLRVDKISGSSGDAILSGDKVTIQAHDGSYVDVNGSNVHTRVNQSSCQELTVEKIGEGPVRSGDAIFLKTHEGTYLDVEGESVTAMEEKAGNQQVLLVEREMPYKDATNINFGRNCDMEGLSPVAIQSGATVFLRTSRGNLLDATNGKVRARWGEFGEYAALVMTNDVEGPLSSGDSVYIQAHDGTYFGIEDGAVKSKWTDMGEARPLTVQKFGGGAIEFGDTIDLLTSDGLYINLDSNSVVMAMTNETGLLHGLSVEKGKWSETMGFLHIPKNAGTAVEDAGWSHNIRWGRWLMFGMFNTDGDSWCSTHHVPPQWLHDDGQARYKDMENFCVTRHPYTRALSEYSYVLSQTVNMTDREIKEPELYRYEMCSEKAVNHYLQNILQKVLDGPGKFLNDCHFIPQSEYIWDDDHQWCAHILRMEELPDSFNDLMQSRGYPVRLPTSDNKTNAHGGICPDLAVSSLDNVTLAMLDKQYAVDFRRLGYERNTAF